jgi:hypothetical protein
VVEPVRYLSTAEAAARPSAIAQTISDWPRPASPATKTPETEVMYAASRAMLPRSSRSTPSCSTSPGFSGPTKPIAKSTSCAGISRSVPSTSSNFPSLNSTSTSRRARTLPSESPRNSLVETE